VKAQDIVVFNTEHLSPLFERVIIASGTSNRQTKALAASVRDAVKRRACRPREPKGEDNGEWIIVDCGTAVVHIMQPSIRDYYRLEEIWGDKPVRLKFGAPNPWSRPRPPRRRQEAPAKKRRPRRNRRGGQEGAPPSMRRGSAAKTAPSRKSPPEQARPGAKAPAAKKAPAKPARRQDRRPVKRRQAAARAAQSACRQRPRREAAQAPRPRSAAPRKARPPARRHEAGASWPSASGCPAWARRPGTTTPSVPPELRLELKAVKTEPRGSKTLEHADGRRARAHRSRHLPAARASSRWTSAARR
jgi:ribosome-associated protein